MCVCSFRASAWMIPNVCFHSLLRCWWIVPEQAKEERDGGKKAFTEVWLSKELLYTCIRNNKNTQVIPQTGLSLCFELQRTHTIKSNIAGDANKKMITKEHLSQYLNAYFMCWYCGSELGLNWCMLGCMVMWLDDNKTSQEH